MKSAKTAGKLLQRIAFILDALFDATEVFLVDILEADF